MSVEEMASAGFQVAPDYEELKRRTTKIFEHIPQRRSKRLIKEQLIINE